MRSKHMTDKKSSSHLGAGILVGTIIGVAAGLFMQSKKGKGIRKDLGKETVKLQSKLMKELKGTKVLTKKKYAEVVDKMMTYYMTSKEIAKKDAPEIRDFFMKKWASIEAQFRSLK